MITATKYPNKALNEPWVPNSFEDPDRDDLNKEITQSAILKTVPVNPILFLIYGFSLLFMKLVNQGFDNA